MINLTKNITSNAASKGSIFEKWSETNLPALFTNMNSRLQYLKDRITFMGKSGTQRISDAKMLDDGTIAVVDCKNYAETTLVDGVQAEDYIVGAINGTLFEKVVYVFPTEGAALNNVNRLKSIFNKVNTDETRKIAEKLHMYYLNSNG